MPADRAGRVRPPWWGRPAVWLAIAVVSVLLGVYVAPQFLGGIVLFIPFLWGRGGRDPAGARCASCGARLEQSFAYCPRCGARTDRL